METLHYMYNICFESGLSPTKWSEAIIIPILKSSNSDPRIPMNYRGISLLSCIYKVYGHILNRRLEKFLENNNILVEEQNGFRKNRSCMDHVFVLHSIIINRINMKENVFAAFLDLKKAFDSVQRDLLFYNLHKTGICGKIYFALKSLYDNPKARIRLNNKYTDWFDTPVGVKQGDTWSPTLFSIFINNLAIEVNNKRCGII